MGPASRTGSLFATWPAAPWPPSPDKRSSTPGRRFREPGEFNRAQLASFHGTKVDDLIEPGVRLLFLGINPGLWTAAANAHYARPGNRFWPALQLAGITRRRMDVSGGRSPSNRAELVDAGITNPVPQATARADELSTAQIRQSAGSLTAIVEGFHPYRFLRQCTNTCAGPSRSR
ncbi:MAG TPA: uracil-DNA glycosylase family protein [Nakamurella sp.]